MGELKDLNSVPLVKSPLCLWWPGFCHPIEPSENADRQRLRGRVELFLCRLQLKTKQKRINICWDIILCSEITFMRICTSVFLPLLPLKEAISFILQTADPDFRENYFQGWQSVKGLIFKCQHWALKLVPPSNEQSSSPSIVSNQLQKKRKWLNSASKQNPRAPPHPEQWESSLQSLKVKKYATR